MLGGMPKRSTARLYGLLAIIALSTPLALAVETGLRLLIFPPEFAEVRIFLRPYITPWMWLMTPAALVMTGVGFPLHRLLVRKNLSRFKPEKRTAKRIEDANFDSLMLSTSAPQVPALVSTFGFMLGSELLPVLLAIVAATMGVLSLGLVLRPSKMQADIEAQATDASRTPE